MRKLPTIFFSLLLSAGAISADEQNLLTDSPFLPPGWGAKTTSQGVKSTGPRSNLGRDLEFRGYVEIDTVKQFSIYDKTTKRAQWYQINQGSERFEVVAFDPRQPSVTVKSGPNTEVIMLKSSDARPIPVVGSSTLTSANSRLRAPISPPPSSPPPTPPPSYTPPPPPKDLIRKMAEIRKKNKAKQNVFGGVGSSGSARTASSVSAPGSAPGSAPSSAPPSSAPNSQPDSSSLPSTSPNFIPPPPPSFIPPPPPS